MTHIYEQCNLVKPRRDSSDNILLI